MAEEVPLSWRLGDATELKSFSKEEVEGGWM